MRLETHIEMIQEVELTQELKPIDFACSHVIDLPLMWPVCDGWWAYINFRRRQLANHISLSPVPIQPNDEDRSPEVAQ